MMYCLYQYIILGEKSEVTGSEGGICASWERGLESEA